MLSSLFLAGCFSSTKPVEKIKVMTEEVKKSPLELPKIDVYKHRKVEFSILTKKNVHKKFKELDDKGEQPVYFALDREGYENQSRNVKGLQTMIRQQKTVIKKYEDYQKGNQEAAEPIPAKEEKQK